MSLMKIVSVIVLLSLGLGIEFTIQIPGGERQCFYQVLADAQKYNINTIPKNEAKYQLQISQSSGGSWSSIFYKMAMYSYQKMQVHKLATSSTTYSFCIKNINRENLQILVGFATGIQLMEFQLLPDQTDAQNLEREVSWIQNQKANLYETIKQVQQHKVNNAASSSTLSTKMVLFAILGLFAIVFVNLIFFKQVKKTFKDRKLI